MTYVYYAYINIIKFTRIYYLNCKSTSFIRYVRTIGCIASKCKVHVVRKDAGPMAGKERRKKRFDTALYLDVRVRLSLEMSFEDACFLYLLLDSTISPKASNRSWETLRLFQRQHLIQDAMPKELQQPLRKRNLGKDGKSCPCL